MHGTDEYFDEVLRRKNIHILKLFIPFFGTILSLISCACKVLFTELSRAESQRFLEEMKRDMNANRDMSPYSNESSTRSYCTSLQHGHGASIQSRSGLSLQNQSCSPGRLSF